ncbi:MAG: glyoxylase-like metal-dependent hydrolase (beta-lactamase superfamily II) [Gammaproteobacteria bacterium]|jgi:glyoxylase-like metal-dependent hydrolase (beta-lactamase superfamily II)
MKENNPMIGEHWQVGDVEIRRIVEMPLSAESGIMERLIPDATAEKLAEMPWLAPHFVDAQGRMMGSIHTFAIRTPNQTLVIDTCVGNDKQRTNPGFNQLSTQFLSDFQAAGFDPEDIGTVLCTHLHIDHVGWNTVYRGGAWVPTFPNARYLFGEVEFAHWNREDHGALARLDVEAVIADSVQPVIDAGLVDLVSTDYQVCPEIRLVPTPGHTPGHVSVLIESRGQRALITGDFLHHPCQVTHPEWHSSPDGDFEQAIATRRRMVEEYAGTGTLVIGTHFASPTAGHVIQDDGILRFDVLP